MATCTWADGPGFYISRLGAAKLSFHTGSSATASVPDSLDKDGTFARNVLGPSLQRLLLSVRLRAITIATTATINTENTIILMPPTPKPIPPVLGELVLELAALV